MSQPAPLKTFIIYARSDEAYKQQLLLHLRPLLNSRLLKVWHDGNILPGEDWEKAIKKELSSSDLVLVLVSANSLNSEFIQGEELRTALDRLREGLARVVPVIVSPCVWRFDPVLAGLQALPLFGSEGPKPVNDRVWQNTDEAWANVVENLGNMVLELNEQRIKAALLASELQEAEQRHANQEKEAEASRFRAEQERIRAEQERSRTEQERLKTDQERLRAEKERERKWHEAHNAAWANASEQHNITAYQQFLASYPDSINAREARQRIKTLRQVDRPPVAWGRWAGISVGVLVLTFLLWQLIRPDASEGMTSSHPLTSDTLQPKKNDSLPSQTDEGAKTLSPEKLPANAGVKKEEFPGKSFVFNYPMVRVAGGSFTMGSPTTEKDRDDDECQHTVSVSTFSIGKTEVTQAQWKSVMGSNPSKFKGDNLPVENVSWNDIQAFIKKLNEKTGKKYRVPLEKEWEYAARGGNKSQGFLYAGGNSLSEVAWHRSNSGDNTHPVATKKANELGLYDMSGNVWEWCQDIYKAYPCDKEKRGDGSSRCLRGGSWNYSYLHRSAERNYNETSLHYSYCGFRLAQD